MTRVVLKSVVPILFVRDVEAAAGFFRDTLGFGIDFLHGEPPFYGAVSRDGVCLHLRFVHGTWFAEQARVEHAHDVVAGGAQDRAVKGAADKPSSAGGSFSRSGRFFPGAVRGEPP